MNRIAPGTASVVPTAISGAAIASVLAALLVVAALTGRAGAADVPVVALREADNPLIAFRILFKSGSIDDPAGQEGITALAARMMAEGGTESLTAAQLLEELFPMAADLFVQSDKEVTVFSGRVHKDHLDHFLGVFEDALLRPRWDAREFDRLRDVQLSAVENELRSNNDEELGKETLEWMLFKGHPYGHPVDGTVAGIKALDLAMVRAHAAKVFTRNRATIGVAGGFPESLPARLSSALAKLPEGPAPVELAEPKPSGPRVVIVEKECPATAISMGFPYDLRRTHHDFTAMWLGVSAFGEHRQSGGRLFQALREKRGLNYGDYAYPEAFRQHSYSTQPRVNTGRSRQFFSIWIRPVEHQNRLFATRCALWQLDKLLAEGLSDDEVAQTRGFLDGYTRLWELTTSRRLGFALDDRFNGTERFLETSRARFPAVTTEAVNVALKKWVDPSQLRFAFVTTDASALRDAIVSGAPSPIDYPTPKPDKILEQDKAFIGMPLGITADEILVVKATDLFEK
jgi:zinc protease